MICPSLKVWFNFYRQHYPGREGGYSFPDLAVLGVHAHGQGLTLLEVLEAENADLVIGVDLIVVGGVGKGQGEHSLFLEIGFVDTGKGADDDGRAVQVTWFQRCVFSGRTLAVVFIANDDPFDTFRQLWYSKGELPLAL